MQLRSMDTGREAAEVERTDMRILVNVVGYALKEQITNTTIRNKLNIFGIRPAAWMGRLRFLVVSTFLCTCNVQTVSEDLPVLCSIGIWDNFPDSKVAEA
jgi:hypothetical protein